MYSTIVGFLGEWERERASTLSIMHCLTDSSLAQKVSPDGRSLGYLAWHVVLTLGEMCAKAGLPVDAPAEESEAPRKAGQIASAYEAVSGSVAEAVRRAWTDDMLADQITLYGGTWTKGGVLDSLVKHQIHHRAQMTVLMRQAGLMVPGIYGPAREEWARMGMPPQR
jgi:uncharacterized damage-inducible protein DinB